MKLFRITILIFLLILVTATYVQAEPNQAKSFSLSTNPLKLAIGLINVEFEYQISSSLTMSIFTEYLLTDNTIKRENHPDLTIRVEPRWYFNESTSSNVSGFYGGLNCGYTWSGSYAENTSFYLGAETGYKYFCFDSYYLLPRFLLTYPFNKTQVIPGFEIIVGKLF